MLTVNGTAVRGQSGPENFASVMIAKLLGRICYLLPVLTLPHSRKLIKA